MSPRVLISSTFRPGSPGITAWSKATMTLPGGAKMSWFGFGKVKMVLADFIVLYLDFSILYTQIETLNIYCLPKFRFICTG